MQHTITAPSSRTSRLLAAVGAAALVCFVPSAALGQGTEGGAERIDEVRKSARAHVGPFYATPGVLLKELGVDSNVFNASGEQVSDFTFTLTPKLDVWVPVARRALVQATTASDLVWYAKYDTERSVDPLLAVRGDVFLHRITLFAENQYLNSRQRMNYEIDVRSRHVRNDTAAGVDVQITPKFSVEAAVRRDTIRFDSDAVFDGTSLQRTLNQNTTGFSLTARERITPLTTIALRYDRLRDEFPFSPERDSASYRVMPGVEFKPRALVKGTAYVGYRRFTPEQAAQLRPFSGLVAQLGLSYTLMGSTTFGASVGRDLTYSYSEAEPFFINESIGASVRRALGRRFDVLLSIDRYQYEYQNLLTQPASATTPRIDVTWNYAGSVGYRLGRDGRIGVGVSYWQRESPTQVFREYDNLRFGTTVTYGF